MKRTLLLSGLIAATLGFGMAGQAHACGQRAHQGCTSVPSARYKVLLRETDDFRYWMTYSQHQASIPAEKRLGRELIDANIQRHLGGSVNTGVATTSVSRLLARMRLSRFPLRDTVTVLSATSDRAVERVHWQIRGGHGPLVRLNWTYSVVGWEITDTAYLETQ